jgi:hypothetical protein
MSALGREGADGRRVPPASIFTVGWRIPAEILEPLLRRPAPDDVPADAGSDRAKRSADGSDAESSAG